MSHGCVVIKDRKLEVMAVLVASRYNIKNCYVALEVVCMYYIPIFILL